MPAGDPADQADFKQSEPSGTSGPGRRAKRDRHGRRAHPVATKQTGPRYTVGPAKTVPMTGDEYARAVRAWAVLIAAWWTDHPPDQEDDTTS